jgi:hypothetical protein
MLKSNDTIRNYLGLGCTYCKRSPVISNHKFNTVDDCKAINDGRQIMVFSSSGAVAAIINKENKEILFYAEVTTHIPLKYAFNKRLAAASRAKGRNRLMMYEIASAVLLFSDSLYSSHVVVVILQKTHICFRV